MKDSTHIERSNKPKKCPKYGQSPLSDIVYGLVRMNDDLKRKIDVEIAVLGSCIVSGNDPRWACTN